MQNIAEMLRMRVAATPDKEALSFQETRYTWSDLYKEVCCLNSLLMENGVTKNEVVGIFMPHSPSQVISIFAVAMADAVFSIINPLLKKNQVFHQVQDADMSAVIGTRDLLSNYIDFFNDRRIRIVEVNAEGCVLNGRTGNTFEIDMNRVKAFNIPADVANIIYTSGSTGLAKGVVVLHRTLLDGARIVTDYLKVHGNDTIVSILPFSFDYGLNQLMGCVYRGAKIVIHQYLMPNNLIKVLKKEAATGMAVVPSMWPQILHESFTGGQAFDLPDLRYITTGGGFHTQELLKKIVEFFPCTEIIVQYGLTESFRSSYLPFSEIFSKIGSIGKPVPEVELLVMKNNGEECSLGEKGELVHRGAFINYGYLNNTELTQQKYVDYFGKDNRWLPEKVVRSGDLVSKDEDGYLYFHGRMDMQIKSSGYRISPEEVESAVMASVNDVKLVAVFALPDPLLGESVNVAYETYSGNKIEKKVFIEKIQEFLPNYALPKVFDFYKNLPITHNGKINYQHLKQKGLERNNP